MGGVVNELGRDKAPDIPSYQQASRGQWESGVQSAIINAMLNRPNEVNPFGSRSWRQAGTTKVGGMDIPNYTAETAVSEPLQQILDRKMRDANSTTERMDLSSASPVYSEGDLRSNRDAVTDALYRRSTRMMDPRFEQSEERLRTDLANKGFQQGNTGYDRAMSDFGRERESAYQDAQDRALLAGGQEQSRLFDLGMKDRVQDIAEMTMEREQPFRELGMAAQFMPNYQNFSASANVAPNPALEAMTQQMRAELGLYGAENERTKAMNDVLPFNSMYGLGKKG